MSIQENPPEALPKPGFMRKIPQLISSIKKGVVSLFTEDPRIQKVLTPDFLEEFREEHRRMCKERREGIVFSGGEKSMWDVMVANGSDMQYRMFNVLIQQYPQINTLPEDLQKKVRHQLLVHCGLLAFA